jgi:O-antigen ligase/tetratricopeptide (TPR) repeat protein
MHDALKAVVYASAFLVLFVPLFVADSMFFPFITGKNFTFRILVTVAVAAWVLLACVDRAYRPRFSWIALSGLALLLVMFFANLFGEYPLKSFWSNFERMEGYVTLVYFYLYFLVLAHTLRTKPMWQYFFYTSLAVAGFVALRGLSQSIGSVEGSARVDSTLGNAAYMAIYMLFHIFILLYLAVQTSRWMVRVVCALGVLLFTYVLLETGTRGTFIGLVVGAGVTVSYLGLFARQYPELRKAAAGALVLLVLLAGLFYTFRDSSFVQNDPNLKRFANIDLGEDLRIRGVIWGMALEGVKQRPLLGWGQGNFNYVFNAEYDPRLHSQEQWFDRVHNLPLDWLIAGGVLGFLAYVGIWLAIAYYLLWRPLFHHDQNNDDAAFTVPERAVLLGLLAAYLTHNLVVFDNLVSYVYFAAILALIHARVSTPIRAIANYEVNREIVTAIVAPVVVIATALIIWLVHVPGIQAAHDIIDAFRADTIDERFAAFEQALDRNSFADQEIIEQLTQQAINVARNPSIDPAVKEQYLRQAESEIEQLIVTKPGDARVHVFFGGFYRAVGQLGLAKEQIDIARSLSPNKQSIILEQALLSYQQGDLPAFLQYAEEAHRLAEEFPTARNFYAAALVANNRTADARDAVADETTFAQFATDNVALGIADRAGANALLIDMLAYRIAQNPSDAQSRASLAFVYYRTGDLDTAITVLEAATNEIPSFETVGQCYIENLRAGNQPDAGC